MRNLSRLATVFCLVLIAACAHRPPDPNLAGKFRIGAVRVVIPSSPGDSEIAAIIEQSFRDVISAYGSADRSLPVQNLVVQMRKPIHRNRAFGLLKNSQIRGRVHLGTGKIGRILSFSYIEDPQVNWRVNFSSNSRVFYNRQNTFTRLGRLLALDVVGRIRGAPLSPNGKRVVTDQAVLNRLNSNQRPVYAQPATNNAVVYRKPIKRAGADSSRRPLAKRSTLGPTPPPPPS